MGKNTSLTTSHEAWSLNIIRNAIFRAKIGNIELYEAALIILPLLLFYFSIVVGFSTDNLHGDQEGYLDYAARIVTGKYFSNPADVHLWWGPGYPLILAPFVALKIPLIYAKLLNALFLYCGILFIYSTLKLYIHPLISLAIAFFAGLYLPFLNELHLILSEPVTFFLISGLQYYFCRLFNRSRFSLVDLLLSAMFMAYLGLTKVFYGYMILILIVLYSAFYLWQRTVKARCLVLVYSIALIFCTPYLIGTYYLTGNAFYWGTSGGDSLYWMSTPYANELGDWFNTQRVLANPQTRENHATFLQVTLLSEPEMDTALRKMAIENITHNPKKYFFNWLANIGRLLFSYPYSYTQQKLTTFYYIVPNAIIVTLFLFSLIPAILRRNQIPFEIKALLSFAILAFCGTSLLSAYERFFAVLVPLLIVWMAIIYMKIVKIGLAQRKPQA